MKVTLIGSMIFFIAYCSYHKGFMNGVESEQETITSAKLAVSHGNEKLNQCNQVILRNCGQSVAGVENEN